MASRRRPKRQFAQIRNDSDTDEIWVRDRKKRPEYMTNVMVLQDALAKQRLYTFPANRDLYRKLKSVDWVEADGFLNEYTLYKVVAVGKATEDGIEARPQAKRCECCQKWKSLIKAAKTPSKEETVKVSYTRATSAFSKARAATGSPVRETIRSTPQPHSPRKSSCGSESDEYEGRRYPHRSESVCA